MYYSLNIRAPLDLQKRIHCRKEIYRCASLKAMWHLYKEVVRGGGGGGKGVDGS